MDLSPTTDHTFYGVVGLIVIQLGKTAREWIRDKRRFERLLEIAMSNNRKTHDLTLRLEEKGLITPNPVRPPVRNATDPVTQYGISPLYRK